jgi:serine/threonine protein phosphatase 1
MSTWVIGDVHGCGIELQSLIEAIQPTSNDRVFLVGDLFDRGCHAHLVWKLIKQYNLRLLRGNHESKFLKFIHGEKKDVPLHYFYAAHLLKENNVPPLQFQLLLESTEVLVNQLDFNGNPFIVVHAAVNVKDPVTPHYSLNVYGKIPTWHEDYGSFESSIGIQRNNAIKNQPDRVDYPWWDYYQEDIPVYYGHSSTWPSLMPRVRYSPKDQLNSFGLDTSACHAGKLTAVCVETKKTLAVQSSQNWFNTAREKMLSGDDLPPNWKSEARDWLLTH